ncbi:hypothetical protein [Candidatus Palauibacter sp.]|uniref:hypothetical protein n=1 Tax=Candidatus Palauibacter sp. TaxID=3101350 RepID=UPI003B5C7149
MHRRLILTGVVVAGLGVGCGGEVGVSDPPPGGDGRHLRPGLTVNVGVASEAAGVAEALGWAGGVPGAEVRVHRIGTDFAWETAVTDDRGTAYLPQLVSGRYRVAVYRPLTDAESAQAGVAALASGRIAEVVGGGTEATMELVPNRVGALVISEIYAPSPPVAELRYNFHMYFELYNNSQQTVFLDGLTFGRVQLNDIATPETSCAESARLRKDPDGVWAEYLHRFPGSGGEYPVAPGDAVVVALDAIDHSVVDPRFPDLSNADFELLGSGDVDNPAVPNLVEIGLRSWPHGHGLLFYNGHSLFIANEVDTASLQRTVRRLSGGDVTLIRVAATALIDVMWLERAEALQDQRYERCDGVVHETFDQLGGGFVSGAADLLLTPQRLRLSGAAGPLTDAESGRAGQVRGLRGPITSASSAARRWRRHWPRDGLWKSSGAAPRRRWSWCRTG